MNYFLLYNTKDLEYFDNERKFQKGEQLQGQSHLINEFGQSNVLL